MADAGLCTKHARLRGKHEVGLERMSEIRVVSMGSIMKRLAWERGVGIESRPDCTNNESLYVSDRHSPISGGKLMINGTFIQLLTYLSERFPSCNCIRES